jgi:hypothetical protein
MWHACTSTFKSSAIAAHVWQTHKFLQARPANRHAHVHMCVYNHLDTRADVVTSMRTSVHINVGNKVLQAKHTSVTSVTTTNACVNLTCNIDK